MKKGSGQPLNCYSQAVAGHFLFSSFIHFTMALNFETKTYAFIQPETQSGSASFSSTVLQATVVLQGIDLTYNDEDHNRQSSIAKVTNIAWSGGNVTFDVALHLVVGLVLVLHGNITVAVIAETA